MKKTISKLISILMVLLMLTASAALGEGLTLSAPLGAPSIAVATMAEKDPENFSLIAADTIAAEFARKEADFIIAPVNAGAKLFKAGKSTYRLAAMITWGNLVFASQRDGFTLEDMNGATVTLFGEETINASVALFVMDQLGIVPAEISYLADASQTQQLLLTDPDAIVMTAEPAVTAAQMKKPEITSYLLTDELKKISGYEGFAQAGLFVREETISDHGDEVAVYLEQIQAAAAVDTNLEDIVRAAVALEILPNEKVATAAIPRCGIRYVSAAEAREMVEYTANIDLSQFGGEMPADDFYYDAK